MTDHCNKYSNKKSALLQELTKYERDMKGVNAIGKAELIQFFDAGLSQTSIGKKSKIKQIVSMKHSTPNHNKIRYACNILYRESLFLVCLCIVEKKL